MEDQSVRSCLSPFLLCLTDTIAILRIQSLKCCVPYRRELKTSCCDDVC